MKRRPKIRNAPSGPQPSLEALSTRLKECGITLSRPQTEQLWKYHNMIRKRNHDRELTRIIGFEPMVMKHYVDSLIVGDLIKLPSPIVDIGTGAGFPGIPLKIRYPHLKLILAEPRPKRVEFLEEVRQQLGLKHVSIFNHRVVSRSFQTPVKGVITRALEVMDKTLARTSACVEQGGLVIFMKGPNCSSEIKDCKKRYGKSYRLVMNEPYQLPGTKNERRLVVFERLIPAEIPGEKKEGFVHEEDE